MTDKKAIWNTAGHAGLVLGLVSAIYFAIGIVMGKVDTQARPGSIMMTLGTFVLWAAKFILCIFLMKTFMKSFAANNSEADNSDVFRFGMATAFLSALIYSACYLAYVVFINPDMFSDTIATSMAQMSSMLDSNSKQAIEDMLPKMPTITFFANLIYCYLYGTVLSAILSRNIPPRNPFGQNNATDNQ